MHTHKQECGVGAEVTERLAGIRLRTADIHGYLMDWEVGEGGWLGVERCWEFCGVAMRLMNIMWVCANIHRHTHTCLVLAFTHTQSCIFSHSCLPLQSPVWLPSLSLSHTHIHAHAEREEGCRENKCNLLTKLMSVLFYCLLYDLHARLFQTGTDLVHRLSVCVLHTHSHFLSPPLVSYSITALYQCFSQT